MHWFVSLDNDATPISSITTIWSSNPDSLISIESLHPIASISRFYGQFNAIWEILKLEFRDLSLLPFNKLSSFAKEDPCASDEGNHIIKNNDII